MSAPRHPRSISTEVGGARDFDQDTRLLANCFVMTATPAYNLQQCVSRFLSCNMIKSARRLAVSI